WEWSSDRRSLAFHLVRGIRWHDGHPTTSGDVAFTILAGRDPATGYARGADLAGVDTVLTPNDSTVIVRYRTPQASFPLIYCELPIVPAHLLNRVKRSDMKRAPYNGNPVGNGPFRFVERRVGQLWRFVRNDSFPADLGGPPTLGGI